MFIDVLKNTILITSFVLVIMLIIEYINVQSHGNWHKPLAKNKWLQYLVASLLGIIPGCVGAFAVVSMYMHNIIGFGALVAALITTFGDEAFVMFKLMPWVTLKITSILLVIGFIAGFLVDYFMKGKRIIPILTTHFQVHGHEKEARIFNIEVVIANLRNISFHRAMLVSGLLLVLIGIASGQLSEDEHLHGSFWGWEQIVFFALTSFGLLIILGVSDHFLQEHLWGHLIKKHFLRIFLWTFGAFLFIAIFNKYLHWHEWIKDNQLIVLLLAVLIGIIPESGPHLIFVTLYMQGAIPFSILLSSALVQDGHGALPLLAESKKSFFLAKAINITLGLLVGLVGYFLGW